MSRSKLLTIVFIRHSKSSRDLIGIEDIHRPLNQRGCEDAALMAKELNNLKIAPDEILTSPAIRAYSTALFFANQFNFNTDKIKHKNKLYDSNVATILNLIYKLNSDTQTVFIFGHNPEMENCINSLLKNKIEKLPTTAVCIINSSSENWKNINKDNCSLQHFMTPADFKLPIYASKKII